MEELILKLKQQIIEALNLEEITPEDIDTDAPLFGEGLGLDSIDALELVILLEREYGIRMEDPKANKEVFKSLRTLAEFIEQNRISEPDRQLLTHIVLGVIRHERLLDHLLSELSPKPAKLFLKQHLRVANVRYEI